MKEAIKQSTFSGTVKPWPPDQWTEEMKILINKLLATSKGKQDKLMIVEKEYLRVLYANANDPGC